jgi:5-methyltetrahydropteroyltriglutamate--homocysteine methyltransferase
MITTVVGNFPKVAASGVGTKLIGAMNRWQKQELSDAELEQIFQDVTRAVIKEQEQAGIDVLADGQIRWEDLVTPLAKKVEGFEVNGLERFFDNNVYYRRPILHKTPVRKQPIFLADYLFARSCTTKPLKVVLPGPYTVVTLSEDRYYKDERPFLRSIAEILNEEAQTLAKAGAVVIQFDEPALGFGKPPIKQVVEAINIATSGVKAKTAVYTYFGSLDGTLEALQHCRADLIGVDVVSDPKAIGAVKRLKWTKELAVGCLDARNTKLESVVELHALFDVVRKVVPQDRLYVNPNCGLEFLPFEQASQKLKRLVEAVRTYRP